MAEYPTEAEINNKLMLARTVELHVQNAAESSLDTDGLEDKYILLQTASFQVRTPQARTDHGGSRKPIYTFGRPDITLSFTLSATSDIIGQIRPRASFSTTGRGLPENQWGIRITDAGDNHIIFGILGHLVVSRVDTPASNPTALTTINGEIIGTLGDWPNVAGP